MKAILEFYCDDPDDERQHRYALAGRDALIALERIDNWARERLKYGDTSDDVRQTLEYLRTHMIPHDLVELLA